MKILLLLLLPLFSQSQTCIQIFGVVHCSCKTSPSDSTYLRKLNDSLMHKTNVLFYISVSDSVEYVAFGQTDINRFDCLYITGSRKRIPALIKHGLLNYWKLKREYESN